MFTTGTIANCWFWRRPQSQIDAEVKLGCLCCHYNLAHSSQRGLPQPPSPSVTTVLNRFFPAWLSQKIGTFSEDNLQTHISKHIYDHLVGGGAASLHIRFIKKTWLLYGLQLPLLPTMSLRTLPQIPNSPQLLLVRREPDYIILFFYFHFIIYYHHHLLSSTIYESFVP